MTHEKKVVVWTLKGFDGDKTFIFFNKKNILWFLSLYHELLVNIKLYTNVTFYIIKLIFWYFIN